MLPLGGFVVGVLVGLTSVGSGALIFLLLTSVVRLPLPAVVWTDLLHALLLTTVAGSMQSIGGHVELPSLPACCSVPCPALRSAAFSAHACPSARSG